MIRPVALPLQHLKPKNCGRGVFNKHYKTI